MLFRQEDGDEEAYELEIVFFAVTVEERLRHNHAVTDAEGRYQVPMELLPIGEGIRVNDESGQVRGDARISATVQVHALQMAGDDISFSQKDVYVDDRNVSTPVDLTLP